MITMRYCELMGQPFMQSFQKLSNQSLPGAVSYSVKKLGDGLQKQRTQIQKEYQELIEQFGTKDEAGKLVRPNQEDPTSFDVVEAKMPEFTAAQEAFGERTFTLERTQVPFSAIEKLEWTPAELNTLAPVVAFPPEVALGEATVTPIRAAVAPASAEAPQAAQPDGVA